MSMEVPAQPASRSPRLPRRSAAGTSPAQAQGAELPAWRSAAAVYGSALLVILVTLTAVILALGHDPLAAYRTALKDSLLTVGGFGQTLNRMTPLLLASLTFAVGYRAGLFNIGMDGQIYVGAVLATGVGLAFADGASRWAVLPLALLAGVAGGLLWSLPAAALRVRWGVNEIFTTVMLNFVALHLVEYLATGPWNDPAAGEAITLPVAPGATLPMLIPRGGGHAGVLLAVAAAALTWWVLYRTVPGYELRAVGSNPRAAALGGVAVSRVHIAALCAGAALSGLAGAVEVAGVHQRLLLGLSPNYGILAILVAVLGRNDPLLLIPVNFAFAVLVAATDSLQRTVGLPASAVFMVQGLAVLVVLLREALDAVRRRRAAAAREA